MYRNQAYDFPIATTLHIEDKSVDLKINNCGHYMVKTVPIADTYVPDGRKDYQLLYIASGKGHFYFNGADTVVAKDNMVLYRPNEPQIYDYYASDKTEVFWIHFTGSKIEEYLRQYRIPENKHVFYAGDSPDYQWIFKQIIRELRLQRANYKELVCVLFRQILININRCIVEDRQFKSNMINEMERASHYFMENYSSNISVENYAKERFISINWFIHYFKIIIGVTPMQYILSLRISAAKGYLEKSGKSVSEIAQTVGYDNTAYFSRLFKKHTGLSPTDYRKAYKPETLNNETAT